MSLSGSPLVKETEKFLGIAGRKEPRGIERCGPMDSTGLIYGVLLGTQGGLALLCSRVSSDCSHWSTRVLPIESFDASQDEWVSAFCSLSSAVAFYHLAASGDKSHGWLSSGSTPRPSSLAQVPASVS